MQEPTLFLALTVIGSRPFGLEGALHFQSFRRTRYGVSRASAGDLSACEGVAYRAGVSAKV